MIRPSVLPEYDQDALDATCRRLGLRLVVLFGSHASGSPPPGEESDLDLAVSGGSVEAAATLWDLHGELSPIFPGQMLDLVLLRQADPLFRWEIMREGVLLWGDSMDFLELRAFAYRDFVDSADLRALERKLFEKKMAYVRRRLDASA
jgi:predicted nucleotidyltransferase